MNYYEKIDFSKLNFHEESLSSEEALKDVIPLQLDNEVIYGNKKITVVSAQKESDSNGFI